MNKKKKFNLHLDLWNSKSESMLFEYKTLEIDNTRLLCPAPCALYLPRDLSDLPTNHVACCSHAIALALLPNGSSCVHHHRSRYNVVVVFDETCCPMRISTTTIDSSSCCRLVVVD